jgi:hypothetical protein
MDIDHLLKLVTAARDEGERTNADGPAQTELDSYLVEIMSPRKPLIGAVRKEAFVQGYLRGRFGALSVRTDEELLAVLPEADRAFDAYRKERT